MLVMCIFIIVFILQLVLFFDIIFKDMNGKLVHRDCLKCRHKNVCYLSTVHSSYKEISIDNIDEPSEVMLRK